MQSGAWRFRRISRWLATLASAFAVSVAPAAGLSVTPTSLDLSSAPVQALWLSNTGNAVLDAQVRVFDWSQADGDERLMPSRALAISPPMIKLQPGQRQLIRVIRAATVTAGESSYRILVDELPDPTQTQQGLQFVMQFSIPVFVTASTTAAASLDWRLSLVDGKPVLISENHGGRRAKISDLELLDAQGRRLLRREGLLGYTLAGADRVWPLALDPQKALQASEVQARINGEAVRQTLRARTDAP